MSGGKDQQAKNPDDCLAKLRNAWHMTYGRLGGAQSPATCKGTTMADLISFSKHVEEVLRDADRIPHWTPRAAEKYMADYGDRRQRFEELANGLTLNVIRPRLETMVGYFVNASMQHEEPPTRCSCWFEYSDRFPANARLEFSVEHDARFGKLIVHTKTHMMPVFVRFNEQDNLLLPLDHVDEGQIADWVEERLLEFLDAYLRIDSSGEEFEEELATDPICGMRIRRSDAAASDSYYGHPYYFCSVDCHLKFQQDPKQYVQIKTM
jgi:YHS domain-containing protein